MTRPVSAIRNLGPATEAAFARVEELGRADGPLNLARVYLAQGTVQDKAIDALVPPGGVVSPFYNADFGPHRYR